MGVEIDREKFDEVDYERFAARLRDGLSALRELLARPGFGVGPPSIGTELELHLVDARGRPLLVNREVLADTVDPRVTLEVDRFNLEINSRPTQLAGRPFTNLADQLEDALRETSRAARLHDARVAAIGILPTLTEADLDPSALTEGHRYRALSEGIRRRRNEAFVVRIEGDDALDVMADDVTFEGANTSFQIHLRVEPAAFVRAYNAAQIATAPALAASTNSPFFLGKRLWEETRVALFRQSVDDRGALHDDDWRPARVSFGHGWARSSALELFAESVALHEPLLPAMSDEEPVASVRSGQTPHLGELRLHHGTVWRWNRAVYDDADGGHLRIELRALPAGPSVVDMIASAAFAVGLTLGLEPSAEELVCQLTFGHARRNFYQAARFGLDADLVWPVRGHAALVPARVLVRELLDVARTGLVRGGVDPMEAEAWLRFVERRTELGTTGARWQRAAFEAVARDSAAMLEGYLERSATGDPVHAWRALR